MTQSSWRVSSLLLTQRRNTFVIQRQIKQGMAFALYGFPDRVICQQQATFSYFQMHLNTENSWVPRGQNVFFKIFSWNRFCKAVQTRFVPGETDTNSFRPGAVTSAPWLGLQVMGLQAVAWRPKGNLKSATCSALESMKLAGERRHLSHKALLCSNSQAFSRTLL